MIKDALDLSPQQMEELVDRLPIHAKIRLVRKLEKQTLRERWKTILKRIDERLKQFPITGREIAKEIEIYRKENAKRRR